jgi:hypothetical protein
MDLWWQCPNCNRYVNFSEQITQMFDESGEALFEPSIGYFFHMISCKCGTYWTASISAASGVLIQ